MNEEFAIKLKTILDQSSLNQVKQELSQFAAAAKESATMATAPAANARANYDTEGLRASAEHAKEIEQILHRIGDLETTLSAADVLGLSSEEILDLEVQIEKLWNKASSLAKGKGKTSFTAVSEATVQIKGNMQSAVKQMVRFGAAMIGIQGVYGSIRKATSAWLAQNEELQNKLNAAWYALGSLFAPALEWIINLFARLVYWVDALVKALGFAGLNMDKYGKKTGAAAKAQKQLAGFDEINNLNKDNGGGGGGIKNPFEGIEIDTKWIDILKENLSTVVALLGGVATALAAIKLGLAPIQAMGVGIMMMGIIGLIADLIVLIQDPSWKNWLKVLIDIGAIFVGILIFTGTLTGGWALLIGALTVAIFTFRDKIAQWLVEVGGKVKAWGEEKIAAIKAWWENFKSVCSTLWTNIWSSIKTSAKQDWENIKTVFKNALDSIKNWFSTTWTNVKNKTVEMFNTLKSNVSGFFGNIGSTISSKVKTIINSYIIGPINKVIGWINNLLNFSYGGLSILGVEVIPGFSLNLGNIGLIPQLAIGTNYVPNDMLAMVHQGEAVVPKEFNSEEFFGNDETNDLLRELISVVDSKQLKAYISQSEVGRSAVNYINQQSRLAGESII